MKLFLDDMRKAPFGWELVKTADACITVLRTRKVDELSLDHDLAEEHYAPSTGYSEPPKQYREKTGYDVVKWMVEQAAAGAFTWPPVVILHTLNPVGRENMRATIARHAPHVTLHIRPHIAGAF